ncbi:methyltransferase, UbiE/COQ5 family [Synechococcus sp. PCC 7335]|uniref:methyltransferase domain-containing protein n=1 Tax=Synechococcus sp. (strain ATCC 29403 / PCC 7335) TaxID=91464 RepID=UPI00017ED202|nr:methyltransferase domain-containing protein [Synechococcus sp. PCC 7335]EDX84877.1 methyltransferase, UbiE/COQ5 family [Synechococcus sp. PCC 7335]
MNSTSLNWSQIDADKPASFIDYLDTATAQSEMQRYKRKSYDLLGAAPGAFLLDVGCGTGEDAAVLAERVGPDGRVVGLDCSAALIKEARHRIRAGDLSLTFQVGDVHHLDMLDNSFDGCRADRLFMHIEDRQQALAEMVRVTRPKGRVLVREPDWDTLIVDHPNRALTRKILNPHFDQAIRHTFTGGELYRLFHHAGLENITVADTSTLLLTDFSTANQLYGLGPAATRAKEQMPQLSAQISAWLSDLQQADKEGMFFSAITGFTVVGYKPTQ